MSIDLDGDYMDAFCTLDAENLPAPGDDGAMQVAACMLYSVSKLHNLLTSTDFNFLHFLPFHDNRAG
jgi:hypothetical protein